MSNDIDSLAALVQRIRSIDENEDPVTLQSVLEIIGPRSFGPVILLAGLVTMAPLIGDVPGVPTMMAAVVILTAGQVLFGKHEFWLPAWLRRRSISRDKLGRFLGWMDRPAKILDRLFSSRLEPVTKGWGVYLIAVACILVALVMPFLEAIPFSSNIAAIAWVTFGLATIFRDGYVAIFALLVSFGLFAWLASLAVQRFT